MSELPEVDFTDLEHGIGVLEGARHDLAQVRAVCRRLLSDTDRVTGSAADDFRRVVSACALYGDGIERVRPAFLAMAVAAAGNATAAVVRKQIRARSAEHGRRGGRPASAHDAEWLRLYELKKVEYPNIKKAGRCKMIAREWKDAQGRSRAWTTIRDGIRRAKAAAQTTDDV